jgi:hypothetical protein
MGLPVLVAALLAEEHDVPVVVEPDQPGPEIPVGHASERARLRHVPDRTDPQVQHAGKGSQKCQSESVRADADDRPVGIGEQEQAGQQRHRRLCCRRHRSAGRLRAGWSDATPQHHRTSRDREEDVTTIELVAIHLPGLPRRDSA